MSFRTSERTRALIRNPVSSGFVTWTSLSVLAVLCAACRERGNGGAPREGAYDSVPSLREVVTSDALVGRRVRVRGVCVRSSARELGQAPDSNSWQLESEGVSIYIVGPPPSACSATGLESLTVTAFVAQDTLPAIGELPPAPRRYLIHPGVKPQ